MAHETASYAARPRLSKSQTIPWMLASIPVTVLLPAVIATVWLPGYRAAAIGLILLGMVCSVGLALRNGRIICRDLSRLREAVSAQNPASPVPALQLEETAAVMEALVVQLAKMKAEVHRIERHWMAFNEGWPHLVWTCLPEGACDFVSKQWVEHTGVADSDQFGFGWLEYLHPDDRRVIVKQWKGAVSTGGQFDAQFRLRRHDGTYRWFKSRAVPLYDQSGRIYKWYGINNDIQNLRELQAALNESGARFRRTLKFMPDGIVIYDQDLRIQYVNQALIELVERPASDFIGHRDEEIWPLPVCTTYLPVLQQAVKTQSVSSVQVDVMVEGRRFYVHIRFVPLDGGTGLAKETLAVVQDMTQWKQTEEKLLDNEMALEKARRLNAEKQHLLDQEKIRFLTAELIAAAEQERRKVAIEMHDSIGQHLAIAKLRLEMALKGAPSCEFSSQLSGVRDLIVKTIADTRSLAFELNPPDQQDGPLRQALEELVEYIQTLCEVAVDFSWNGPDVVLVKNQITILYAAVRELLLNVVKHSNACRASLTVNAFQGELQLTVADDGTTRQIPLTLKPYGGTPGFGLATMARRLAPLSGSFSIDSQPESGTRATIIFPLSSEPPTEV